MADHPITLNQLEEGHALILGTTGSGKTFQLRGLIELLRRASRHVGAIDKLGNHWGLTLDVDGKGPGLEFVIFGGKRAHVPMQPGDGARLGRLFVARQIPAIFDVSQWHGDDQQHWVAGFADAVFTAADARPLYLAMDEAQSWVPQGGGGEAFRSVQRLAEQGRGNGIRLLLTCQRLARLDATVREMMRTVVVMRQKGTIDRKAVADLVAEGPADLEKLKALPKLKTGTGFLWDEARDGIELVSFPANATFDSSKTPRHGDTPPAPIAVSSALVDELRKALAPAETEIQKSGKPESQNPGRSADNELIAGYERDLVARQARIEELEDQVTKLQISFQNAQRNASYWHRCTASLVERLKLARDTIGDPNDFRPVTESRAKAGADAPPSEQAAAESVSRPAAGRSAAAAAERMAATAGETAPPRAAPKRAAPEGPEPLNATGATVAELLKAIAPRGIVFEDALLVLGRRPGSGDAGKARKSLIENGLMTTALGKCLATRQLLEDPAIGTARWPSVKELLELWEAKLRGPGGDILRVLFDSGPASKDTVAGWLGKSSSSGWWGKGMKDLRRSNIITEREGQLHLHPFFRSKKP